MWQCLGQLDPSKSFQKQVDPFDRRRNELLNETKIKFFILQNEFCCPLFKFPALVIEMLFQMHK